MKMNKAYLFLLLSLPLGLASCNNSDTAQNSGIPITSVDYGDENRKFDVASTGNKSDARVEVNNQDNATAALEGKWVHEEDSLAFVKINGGSWTFGYEDQEIDEYSFTVVDELSQFVDPGEKAEFIVLTNQTDTMYYELNGVTEESLSLTWYPAGRIHVYRRKN